MGKGLLDRLYVTEERFGFADYREPIVWFDKLLIVAGILAGICGRVFAAVWVLRFVLRAEGGSASPHLLLAGVLAWASCEYFLRTGHRGLIYHHMDLLASYLDGRLPAGK